MRKLLLALFALAFVVPANAQNYNATAGSGLVFGSKFVGSVNYPQWVLCDPATPAQCAAVSAGGALSTAFASGAAALGSLVDINNGTNTPYAGMGTTSLLGAVYGLYTVAGNPVPCKAGTAPGTQTPVSTGVTTASQCDLNGNPYTNPNLQPTIAGGSTFVKGTTAAMTGTASTQILAAVATKVLYAMRVSCKGDPANAVGTKVQIQDGSAGTVLDTLTVGPNGGGEQATGATPLFWTTAGNGLFAQDVTTAASVICTASGYSG